MDLQEASTSHQGGIKHDADLGNSSNASSSLLSSSSSSSSVIRIPWTALWSGTCGALASSMAKLAFFNKSLLKTTVASYIFTIVQQDNSTSTTITTTTPTINDDSYSWLSSPWWYCEVLLRALFLLSMITANLLAVGTFVQGMEESGSVKGTALATAANCIVSALLGIFVWNDDDVQSLSSVSLQGLALVMVGIVILVGSPSSSSSSPQQPLIIQATPITTTVKKSNDPKSKQD